MVRPSVLPAVVPASGAVKWPPHRPGLHRPRDQHSIKSALNPRYVPKLGGPGFQVTDA